MYSKIARVFLFFLIIACAPVQSHKSMTKYVWKSTDTIEAVAEKYNIDPIELRQFNDIYEPQDLVEGKVIVIPKSSSRLFEAPKNPKADQGKITFVWPSEGQISSPFGKRWSRFHYGVDFRSNRGKEIKAAASGYVEFAGSQRGFGKVIIIRHSQTFKTLYAHNKEIYVSKGQKVLQGSRIAIMGRTGRVTGVHLHFEIHKNGKPVDPLKILPRKKLTLVYKKD